MKLRRLTFGSGLLGVCAVGLAAPLASAQADWDAWEVNWGGGVTLVASLAEDPDAGLPETESILGELSGTLRVTRVLENGAEIGFRGAVRAQRDHPARPGFAGRFEAGGAQAPGLSSGLSPAGPAFDQSATVSIESAYLYIDGGYGELTLGRDSGVAARFREAPPEVFRFARSDSPLLDPSGLAIVATADRISGQSAKVSYASPRWLGFRAGVSLAPDADEHDGLDRTLDPFSNLELGTSVEVAVNGSRRFGRGGPRLSGGISWSRADREGNSAMAADAVEGFSASSLYENGNWSVGLAWHQSDEGLVSDDYTATSIAIQRQTEKWGVSLGYGTSERNELDGESLRLGIARKVSDQLGVAFGWQWDRLDRRNRPRATSGGPVVEITLRM